MADDSEVSYYREIIEKQNGPVIWKEITVNTGHSTTQKDVKFPDLAGGYAYKDSSQFSSYNRNRFIYWQTSGNVIELSEVSLDFNLRGRHLRISFTDAPVICGISFFETTGYIVILACTASSAHRLLFPHPNTLHAQEVFQLGPEANLPSVFADVSSLLIQNPANLHNINVGGTHTVYVAHTGAMHLARDGEAVFAMAIQNGGILVVKMPPFGSQGVAVQHEIKQSGVMSRFLGGFMPSVIRGPENSNLVTSLAFHDDMNNIMIFAISKDSKLRIWSSSTYEFLGTVDLLEYVPDMVDKSSKVIGGTGHVLKMSPSCFDQSVYIAVFLSFANKCQFVIYQLNSESRRYSQPTHVATLFGIEGNLVDFYVTSKHLWTLWTLRTGEPAVRYAVIDGHKRREWLEVLLCSKERLDLDVNQPVDPREMYMNYIFHRGMFSTAVILKALKIYRRSIDASVTSSSIPISILKSEVCQAVEAEIRLAVGDEEMVEEEFVQLQLQLWSKFYSCCVQYHERGMKPLGIFSDEANGMIGLVRKAGISFLYPCPSLDQLYLGGITPNDYEFSRGHPALASADKDYDDLAILGRCLKVIRETVDEQTAVGFENGILSGCSPVDLIETSVRSLQTVAREDVLRDLDMELQKSHDVFQSVETMVELLDISLVRYDGQADEMMNEETNFGMDHVFGSATGVAVVSEVFRQTMLTRFELCRDLLLLVKLLPHVIDKGRPSVFGVKVSEIIFQLGCLVRSYHLLRWCAESLAIQEATSTLESSRKQLESLNLLRPFSSAVFNRLGDQQLTLLEAFIHADGGARVRKQLVSIIPSDQESFAFWKKVLLPMVTLTARLIWPTVPGFVFPQSLIALGQHLAIQGYVRLLREWCVIDTSSRRFLLGQSFLSSNEPYKALDCFLAAAQDVMAEEFLISFMSKVSSDPTYIEVQYYLQVINLFEEFDFPHLVVYLAKFAINMAMPDDPNLPTLWSKVFKNELEMGHSSEAYKALMGNPDPARRKDCLRQFLVVLCERNELPLLIDLPYRDSHNNLEPEVVTILHSRAKSVELTKQNYYDLLYAFYVKRSNYRKAGAVMYEYGARIRHEVRGLKGLQRQAKCYLACMDVLRLGDPKFAWILKPVGPTSVHSSTEEENGSPSKRARKEDPLQELLQLKQHRIEVLSMEDIRKEYVLVHAHLMLLQRSPQTSQLARPSLRPDETVGLLANAGMFDLAIELCQIFNLPMTPVFELLLLRCIWLSRGGASQATVFENQYTSGAWSWLQFNDTLPGATSQEAGRAADSAWRLLQLYLEKFEEKSARYHKCVAAKALQQGFDLPSWFLASYKKINAAELLRLYLSYGFLEEATELATEYILAVMGRGKEYFGLDDYLHAGSTPVWLPYTSLDLLLCALDGARGKDKHFAELHHQFTTTLEKYFSVVQNATENTLVMLRGC